MGICGSTNSKNGPPTSKYSEASSPAPNDEGDHHRPDQSKMSHSASEALNGLDPHLKESVKNRKAQKNKKFKEGMVEDDNTLHEVNIVKIDRSPSKSDLAFLTDNMKNHFFFSNLSPEELENLAKKFFYCSVPADTYVFKQNDAASCFFFIHEGEVIVEIDNSDKRHLTTGQGFGELALLYNAPRSASIKAARESRFWAIDRKTFKKVVEDVTAKQFKENREFLNKVAYFDSMTDSQKDSIASVLLSQQFKKGQVIISEGDQASSYYIIKEGSVECVEKGRFIRALNAGESFGEQALYASGHRTLSVLAQTDCRCLALSREALQEILGAKILQVIQANWSRWALKQDKIFSQLTKLQMEKWIQNATCENLEPGTVIMEKNKPLSKLVIVLNGELQFGNRVYAKGTVFESSYMLGQTNKK
jgi:cGMP-dependent protein kinase